MSLANQIIKAREINTELDSRRSTKYFKRVLKEVLNLSFTDEFYTSISNTYAGNNIALLQSIDRLKLETASLGYTTLEEYMSHPMPLPGSDSKAWSIYNKCQGIFYGSLKADLKDISKRDAKELLGVFLDTFAKEKRDTVIANQLMVKIARALRVSEDVAMMHLDIWSTTGILSHHYKRSTTEKLEHRYQLHIDMTTLREVALSTSKRNVKFYEPEAISNSLCIVKKFKYEQELSDTSIRAIEHMNSTAFSLRMTEADLEKAIHMELFGLEDTASSITEQWQKNIASAMRSEYQLIMATGNSFYVDHATDGVMRIYTNSNYFSVQKGSWMRQHMTFADGEYLTSDGIIELKRYIAMDCSSGKLTLEEADRAFELYSDQWKAQGLCHHEFVALEEGYTGILGQQDSQSSNYQIYAVGLGDADLLAHVGINSEYRSDFRDVVSHIMNTELNTDIWDKNKLKPAVMTKGYSAKFKTIMYGSNYDEEFGIINPKGRAIPLMSVSDKTETETWLAFSSAMKTVAGKALRAMEVLEKIGGKNTQEVVQWELPDGQIAQVAPRANREDHIKWASADGHVHTLTHHTSIPHPQGAATALAPRIIQSIDAYIVRRVAYILADMEIPFCSVHDEFITHFNYCGTVRDVYRDVLLEIFDTDLLSNIITQIAGYPVHLQNNIDRVAVRSMIERSQYHIAY